MSVERDSRRPVDNAKLDRLVLGVDFTAPSIVAVRWVREHFAPDAESLVVHALDVREPPEFMRAEFPSRAELLKSARAGADTRLQTLRREQSWGAVGLHVADGRAEDVLAEAARQTQADMVIVGEHAHPRGAWTTLGSTAEALVRCSPIPVLLARHPSERKPARILVAIDDSSHARVALEWGDSLARHFDATLTVLHVFRPVYLGTARIVSGMDAAGQLEEKQMTQARQWLEQLVRSSGVRGAHTEIRVERGDPVSAVVAAQRGSDVDLVVVGSRGAGGAARMLLGSVASGVLRGASCPVLVVSDRD